MAARRYEISLWVLKNISRVSAYFFQHEKRNLVSPSDHVMFYLLYKHQWNTKPFYLNSFLVWRCGLLWSHNNGDNFTCEDNMLFSHVKISSFFARKLTWYFIGVNIIICVFILFLKGERMNTIGKCGAFCATCRPFPIVLVKCWKVAHWDTKKVLKKLPKIQKVAT